MKDMSRLRIPHDESNDRYSLISLKPIIATNICISLLLYAACRGTLPEFAAEIRRDKCDRRMYSQYCHMPPWRFCTRSFIACMLLQCRRKIYALYEFHEILAKPFRFILLARFWFRLRAGILHLLLSDLKRRKCFASQLSHSIVWCSLVLVSAK